eukprot:282954-Chlamydomonas_euryale.AAC.2
MRATADALAHSPFPRHATPMAATPTKPRCWCTRHTPRLPRRPSLGAGVRTTLGTHPALPHLPTLGRALCSSAHFALPLLRPR